MPPRTRYVESDGCTIAYQVVGDGPVDLVFVPGLISHLDLQWCDPVFADALHRLASFSRLVIMDQRGVGLSDSCASVSTVEERVADVGAVIDAAGCTRPFIIGHCHGGPPAIVYSATNPDRVAGLVLLSTFAKGRQDEHHPAAIPPDAFQVAMDAIDHWGEGRSLELFNPSRSEGRLYRQLYATFERAALTKGMARAAVASTLEIDVSAALPSVHAPTLVMHCTGDYLGVDAGRYLADALPHARFIELDGAEHAPFSGDGSELVIDHVQDFVTGGAPASAARNRFGAVLMTDIVSSTDMVARLGDARWNDLLIRHDVAVRDEIDRHGGECIKFTGDGYLATFSSCAAALRCAISMTEAAARFDLELRCAVHAGPYETSGVDVIGMTVNIASRLTDEAGGSTILASSTVCAAVAGDDFRFGRPERFDLKGVGAPTIAAPLLTGSPNAPSATRWVPDPAEDGPHPTRVDGLVVAFARRFPHLTQSIVRATRARATRAPSTT